ncbi:hypothetical protein BI291_01660 [Thalassotalea sp. PP2-459]|nr:hypothetical protein BI291_01660 [Thalassotalea sp. PP2-459]
MKKKLVSILPDNIYLRLLRFAYKKHNPKIFDSLQTKRKIETNDGYSYKPFDDNKAIFVHIPKCAGVSVCKKLFGNLAGGHTSINEYLVIFEPKNIKNYYKFTFVRNPWDRLVSAYFFLKKGGFGEKDKAWFEKELSMFSSFEQFVTEWVNKENIQKWHHFRPQTHYIIDRHEKVSLDFIGFLENMDDDFQFISNKLNIDAEISIQNKSQHNNYMTYYTEKTKKIVEQVYEQDIKTLGYNFDNSSISEQVKNRA